MKKEVIPPVRNRVWEWPAVANFVLGGAGAGLYLSALFMNKFQTGAAKALSPGIGLLPPVLVILGFLALTLDAGRPYRGLYLLRNLRTSWMSREVFIGGVFLSARLFDLLSPNSLLQWMSAASALGLLVSHGFIFFRAGAVASWNEPLVVIHFLISGLLSGAGLNLALAGLKGILVNPLQVSVVLAILLIDALVWFSYLRIPDRAFAEATKKIRCHSSPAVSIGGGRLLPFVVLLTLLLSEYTGSSDRWAPVMSGLAGLMIVAGSVRQKKDIIFSAFATRSIIMGEPVMDRRKAESALARKSCGNEKEGQVLSVQDSGTRC